MAEATANQVTSVLQGVIQRGTGTGAKIGFSAAGKTGTTQNHADAWFAGYTPNLTAVVWVGFPPDSSGKIPLMTDVRGRRVTGGSFPATIWAGFMTKALEGTDPVKFAAPAGEPVKARPKRRPPAPVAPEPPLLEAPAPELPSLIVPEVPFVEPPVPGI
jgi:penicillin-binding protein 1A